MLNLNVNDVSLMEISRDYPENEQIYSEYQHRIYAESYVIIVFTPDWGADIFVFRDTVPDIDYSAKESVIYISDNVPMSTFQVPDERLIILDSDVKDDIVRNVNEDGAILNIIDDRVDEISFDPYKVIYGDIRAVMRVEEDFLDLFTSYKEYALSFEDDRLA